MRIITILFFAFTHMGFAADPVATNVRVLGEGLYNGGNVTQLTGNYVFTDGDGDADASSYRWYYSTTADGSSGYTDTGVTTQRYTVSAADNGLYFFFEVSPEDDNGETGVVKQNTAGTIVSSSTYSDHTYGSTTTVNGGGTTHYLNVTIGNNKNLTVSNNTTLYIHGDLNTAKTTLTVNSGSTLRIAGKLIASNNLTIINNGTLIIESGLEAGNSAAITISGDVVIGGDLSLAPGGAGSLTVEDGGSLDVEGNLDVPDSDITVNGSGTINVDGNADLGSSPVEGDGDVTIGGECTGTNCGDGQILPIELGYFHVISKDGYNEITWSTLSEINNDYFTIYRSADGKGFTSIGQVAGAGNYQGLLKYRFIDYSPLSGTSYYQLKQTDYDGQFEIFDAVMVNSSGWAIEVLAYPNPTDNNLTLACADLIRKISMTDLNGRTVLSKDDLESTVVTIDTQKLMPGQYKLLSPLLAGILSKNKFHLHLSN